MSGSATRPCRDSIFGYLERHRVENGGRYKLDVCVDEDGDDSDEVAVTVFSHAPSIPAAKEESTVMCSFRYMRSWPGIGYIFVPRGFGWQTPWAELAVIEEAALGETIHGATLAESREIAFGISPWEAEADRVSAEVDRLPLPRVNVNFRYPRNDFYRIIACLVEHAFPFHGRYDVPWELEEDPDIDTGMFDVSIFNRRPSSDAGPQKVRQLCTVRLDVEKQTINLLLPARGSDLETAKAELAALEMEAIGKIIHGEKVQRSTA